MEETVIVMVKVIIFMAQIIGRVLVQSFDPSFATQESHSESRILSDSDKGQTVNIPNIHGFQ